MRVSEITAADVSAYIRMSGEEEDIAPNTLLAAAISYVSGYTGMTMEEIDRHEDITIAVLVICADLYENRQTAVESKGANRTIETILGLYRKNLL